MLLLYNVQQKYLYIFFIAIAKELLNFKRVRVMLFSAKHPYTQTKTFAVAKIRYFLSTTYLDELLFIKFP